MRRLVAIVMLLATLAAATATASPAATATPTTFVLAGGGWGHGVGMSQWGAFGQANAGRGFEQILQHYYRGTELGSAPAALLDRVRVLVGSGLASVALTNAIAVFDGEGKRHALPVRPVTVDGKLELPVGKNDKPLALAGPLTFRAARGSYLAVGGKSFRGDLRVAKAGARLQLVNVVGLEDYLLGVLPGEMPKDWPLEALKAQAVAARTYAVGHLVKGKGFDLYSDWRSQVYYGVGSEAPGPSRAVEETRGRILTFEGAPAQTFYFSSSGGRTISALDAFGSDVPYLVAVDDPWDEVSPNHAWPAQLVTAHQLAKRFGLGAPVADATYVPGEPGKPAALRLTTVKGTATDVRLSDVRARLGLKSTGFRLGVLRLDRPTPPSAPGGALRLTGLARALGDVVLEQRGPSGTWVPVKRLVPSPSGTFAVKLRPVATTVYRLSADGLGGPPLTVRVAA
jgi:stage II sporulation protein D